MRGPIRTEMLAVYHCRKSFFYSWFEFKEEQKYRSKYFVPKTNNDRFANLTKNHFEKVSKKLGYNVKPDRDWLSDYAYSLNK